MAIITPAKAFKPVGMRHAGDGARKASAHRAPRTPLRGTLTLPGKIRFRCVGIDRYTGKEIAKAEAIQACLRRGEACAGSQQKADSRTGRSGEGACLASRRNSLAENLPCWLWRAGIGHGWLSW